MLVFIGVIPLCLLSLTPVEALYNRGIKIAIRGGVLSTLSRSTSVSVVSVSQIEKLHLCWQRGGENFSLELRIQYPYLPQVRCFLLTGDIPLLPMQKYHPCFSPDGEVILIVKVATKKRSSSLTRLSTCTDGIPLYWHYTYHFTDVYLFSTSVLTGATSVATPVAYLFIILAPSVEQMNLRCSTSVATSVRGTVSYLMTPVAKV